jgi:tetratricopeptide (TPR) repeat protein
MTRITSAFLLGFFVVVSAGSASAEKHKSKSAREKAAKKACAVGEFQKGVDILADLYVETDDPGWIYNQGRCYQQSNRWEQAISRFNEFLRKTENLPASERGDAERQIADCEKSLGKTTSAAPPPVAPLAPVLGTPVQTPHAVPQPVVADLHNQSAPPPSDGSRGKGLRVTGIVLAAVGAAAVGTGVVLALKANGLSTADYSRSREDERSSLKTWSLVSYGVGAGAIATGAVLYILGWPSESSSGVAFLPTLAPDGASVLLRGRF